MNILEIFFKSTDPDSHAALDQILTSPPPDFKFRVWFDETKIIENLNKPDYVPKK